MSTAHWLVLAYLTADSDLEAELLKDLARGRGVIQQAEDGSLLDPVTQAADGRAVPCVVAGGCLIGQGAEQRHRPK